MRKKNLISWGVRLGSVALVSLLAGHFAHATTPSQTASASSGSDSNSNSAASAPYTGGVQDNSQFFQPSQGGGHHSDTMTGGS